MGRAFVEAAIIEGIVTPDTTDFESVTGFGVKAQVNGERVDVGADRYMRKLGLDVDVFAASVERMGNEGKTPLYAAIGGRLAAIVAVADPIKEATPGEIGRASCRERG